MKPRCGFGPALKSVSMAPASADAPSTLLSTGSAATCDVSSALYVPDEMAGPTNSTIFFVGSPDTHGVPAYEAWMSPVITTTLVSFASTLRISSCRTRA